MVSNRVVLMLLLSTILFGSCLADVYMHMLRGSNNRLDDDGTNVQNEERLFDSQNNAKGGYNHGYTYLYSSSVLSIEWTNQHGLGANPNVHSEIILQYMCDNRVPGVRDGVSDANDAEETIDPSDPDDYTRGRHEPYAFYQACTMRERNKGLFTADQTLKDTATSTRQNPNADRYGFECTEERDYFPYWHPTPWIDIAILTSNTSRCGYYKKNSQNVKNKGHCELTKEQQKAYNNAVRDGINLTNFIVPTDAWEYNNYNSCIAASFAWVDSGKWGVGAPACVAAPWSRDNHLGNVIQNGFGGYPAMFNWTIPQVASKVVNCVLRIRYNVSIGDYDGWGTYADSNGENSPVTNNPEITLSNRTNGPNVVVQLALNTQQTGRTFEDRSHVFQIKPRPNDCSKGKIYNLQVRGKRGNIVQVYPAVEYDFVPEILHIGVDDCVHLQWTGSNNNPAGNAGQGLDKSDRSNFVQILNLVDNFPINITDITIISSSDDFTQRIRELALNGPANNNGELDDASTWFDAGLLKFKKGVYNYMSTRNNNFSNRSQKGAIVVGNDDGQWWNIPIIIGCAVFGVILLVGIVVAFGVYGSKNPESAIGHAWSPLSEFFKSFVNH